MVEILSVSIDLSKIDKSRIVEGKTGAKYYNLDVIVNDEPDKFGNTVAVIQKQSKEERERKDKKIYLGNGKIVWKSGQEAVQHKQYQKKEETFNSNTDDNYDSLPF